MAANKKPSKKYKPRGVIVDPIRYVVSGVKPPDPDLMLKLEVINHSAMESLTHGTGTFEDWQAVTNMLNVANVLAGSLSIYELTGDFDYIVEAQKAHAKCGARKVKGGSFGYTGEELTAVNTAFAIHDYQLKHTTVLQYERANREVERRIRNKNIDFSIRKELEDGVTT